MKTLLICRFFSSSVLGLLLLFFFFSLEPSEALSNGIYAQVSCDRRPWASESLVKYSRREPPRWFKPPCLEEEDFEITPCGISQPSLRSCSLISFMISRASLCRSNRIAICISLDGSPIRGILA
ncbi:hypothetical protein FOWG_15498 [Fusarium oxysporum f. sp. lycopersici MN25]|nr:hypothetical protein FOWG_15498 [Fusarium oxysporum f. sp. lycopersici MN25]